MVWGGGGGGRTGCVNRCCYVNFLCSAIVHTTAQNNMCDYVILFYLISFILSVHPQMSLVCTYTFCIKKLVAYRDLHSVTSTLRLVAIPPPHPPCMHTHACTQTGISPSIQPSPPPGCWLNLVCIFWQVECTGKGLSPSLQLSPPPWCWLNHVCIF